METNCPIRGCKNKRQSNGKGKFKTNCRRHTQMKRILGYNECEVLSKKELHEEFYEVGRDINQ